MNYMKALLVLFIAILVAGCAAEPGAGVDQEAAKNVVTGALTKFDAYPALIVWDDATWTMTSGGMSMGFSGTTVTYKQGDNLRIDVMLEGLPEVRVYQVDGITYDCAYSDTWMCEEKPGGSGTSTSVINEQFQTVVILADKGVLTFTVLEEKTVAGRSCTYVNEMVDVSKITPDDLGATAAIFGATEAEQLQALQSLQSYETSGCYDDETGYPLESGLSYSVATGVESGSLEVTSVTTSIDINPVMGPDVFVLPAEPTIAE